MEIYWSQYKKIKITINPDTQRMHIRTIDWYPDAFLYESCKELMKGLQKLWYKQCIRWTERWWLIKLKDNKKKIIAWLDLIMGWKYIIFNFS